MTNLEKFNRCSAEILSLLYESFPITVDIERKDYPEYDNGENREIFSSTIIFLENENFLKIHSKCYQGTYIGVVLTSKGFAILNFTNPDILDNQETFGSKIKDIANTGKDEVIKNLIKVAITMGIL